MNTQLSQITLKAPIESKTLFDELFETARNDRPTLTKGAFFEEMVHAFANPKTVEKVVDNPETISALETANFSKENYRALIDEIRTALEFSDDTPDDVIVPNIQAVQQRAMAVPSEVKVEVQRQLAENEILFTIPEPHLSLIQETAKRMNTTCKDIFLDMFIRYTVEQYAEWFYPFCINDKDFKELTGYTQKELKQWLKKINSN